jgi:hypothetical protein
MENSLSWVSFIANNPSNRDSPPQFADLNCGDSQRATLLDYITSRAKQETINPYFHANMNTFTDFDVVWRMFSG